MHATVRTTRNAVALLATATLCSAAMGQGYPAKPVRILTANSAGGTSDIFVRALGDELQATGHALEMGQRLGGLGEGRAAGDDEAERHERVARLEGAEQRQPDLDGGAAEGEAELLAGRIGEAQQQSNVGAGGGADLERAQIGRAHV